MEPSVCEEDNYRKLYDLHAEPLFRFTYYKCRDAARAEDLVQESYLKLWQNCAKVLFEKAKSFLFTVAKNLFLNEVAHEQVKLKHVQQHTPKSNTESPDFILEEKDFQVQLEAAIEALTPAQREVFLMNRIDGLKYREIAETLGISMKAVEKRMSQALAKMREVHKNI